MISKSLLILGAGGMARETAWIAEEINRRGLDQWEVVGFWQNDPALVGSLVRGYPVLDPDLLPLPRECAVVAAIGNPSGRKRAVQEALRRGFRFTSLVHPDISLDSKTLKLGSGVIVCPRVSLTTNVEVHDHVIINVASTISHDCILDDYATISPGCHLAGHTTVEEQAFLGIGAVTIEGHRIGARAVIGAGSVVLSDVAPDTTVVGAPARPK